MICRTTIRAWILAPMASVALGTVEPPSLEPLLTPPPSKGPAVVQVGFDLQDIHSINNEAETFSYSGMLTLRWTDARLAFCQKECGLSEKVYNGAFQFNKVSPVWFPQLMPVNTAGSYDSHGVLLRVLPDGSCEQTEMVTINARTRFDLRKFPFDEQTLQTRFAILGFGNDEVRLVPAEIDGYQRGKLLRVAVPQWELMDIEIADNEDLDEASSFVTMNFTVRRKSLFIIRLVVIPLMVICMLSWSVFWMERASLGNRMSVSFVGILTAVAYQTKVGDLLPQISYVTWIHSFLAASFFLMCATALANLVVGAYGRKDRHDLADRIDRHCRWIFPAMYAAALLLIVLLV